MRRALFGACISILIVAGCGSSAATSNPAGGGGGGSSAAPDATQQAAGATAAVPPTAGQTAAPAAPANLDPCKLITQAEAAAALGEPVDPGKQATAGASSCLWSGNDPKKIAGTDGVDVSVTDVGTFNESHKAGSGITVTPVPGLGDEAYFVDLGIGYVNLHVKKGSTAFTVEVMISGASTDKLEAADKSLAQVIVGRI